MRTTKFLWPVSLWLASAVIATAVPPEIEKMMREALEKKANAEGNEAPEAEAPEETEPVSFGKALLELDFNRSPAAIFEALENRSEDEEAGEVERFNEAVMFGNWKQVGETLASIPIEEARPVYQKLIATLGKSAVPVGTLLREPDKSDQDNDPFRRRRNQANENQQLRERSAPLLSEDFYGLVEAAPGGLTEAEIPAVAKLAEVALGEGGRKTLALRLKTGWKGLGGDTKEGGILATQLLSALGWIRDAAPFLPLKSEEWDKAETEELMFALEYFTAIGIEDRDERQLTRAAEVSARLMKSSRIGNYTRPQFRLAMTRLVSLLPALEPEAAQQLIREQLFSQRASLSDLITIFAEQGKKALEQNDLGERVSALGAQHLILEALVPMKEPLPPNVAILVLNWLAEAEACYRAGGVVATEMSQAERMMLRRYGMSEDFKVTTLSTENVLAAAPPQAVVNRLNAGLSQRVNLTLLKLRTMSAETLDLEILRPYVKNHPGLERQICEDVIAAWVSRQSKPVESERVKRMRAYGLPIPPQLSRAGSGIPLTRLRQNKNIEELKKLLAELREISPEPLDPALIVEAFMALHSGAEVYKIDDITAIFGPPEEMVKDELLNLLDGMRTRLGEEWRDQATQQRASTNRTKEETKDEVSRGYRTALELARRGIPDDDEWRSLITRGQLFYDASQYEFEREIELSEYVDLRDQAFASFRNAAARYAAGLAEMPKRQWTITPYQSWFFVMLGASDLAQLTNNPARTDPGLQAIGDAMRALPGEASERHLTMFGEMLGSVSPQVPPNVRQRFLHSGLKIIGEDHPAAEAATRPLAYYQELLDEIQLRVAVDGPTEVGHGQPFGAFISLEATRQLLRESGGFGKYLRLPGQNRGNTPNYRADFRSNIQTALEETFEIVSLTFHDASVKPIPLARDGWVETPMAYAVLMAKNAAVDRIPSVQLDMDFVEKSGKVVLPVMSQVQPINARDSKTPARPCPDLQFVVTLDERDWKEGTLVVDVSATGKGIIAGLDDWLEYERKGFEAEVVDSTLAISEFVSDGSSRSPRADRSWQITYQRIPGMETDLRFPFPAAIDAATAATIEYKLYRDTDLIELGSEEAAQGIELRLFAESNLRFWIIVAAATLVLGFLIWLAVRSRKPRDHSKQELTAPAEPTPFSTVAFLRRVQREYGSRLSAKDDEAITTQIREIETRCFAPGATEEPDCHKIVSKWLRTARSHA